MHITKPHCTCLLLSDREHAVRWRKSRRGEKWEIRSLVERLRHSNTRIFPSPPRPPAERFPPRLPLTARGPLIHWFRIGFACACITGGAVTEIRATEAAPPAALGLPLAELGEKAMNVKSMIVLAAVVAAIALGACR